MQEQGQSRKVLIFVAVGVLALVGITAAAYLWSRKPVSTGGQHVVQSHRTYHLNLMEGMAYKPNEPSEIMFDIRDENNTVLKDFDTVHEKLLHLIVVRKDRAYFQHVHPVLDKNSGTFAPTGFTFPIDGEYRIFADFTPSNAQMGSDGMKLAVVAYKDVKVGSGQYTAQPLGADKMTSDVDGFSTKLSLMSHDAPSVQPYAGVVLTLGVEVNRDGAPYKNLQTYLGALGHMVVLGPNLEYIHAHAIDEATVAQTGTIGFQVTFPDPGQYKIYLQAKADGRVHTTDYNYTVKPMPSSNNNDSMQGMDHMGH